VEFPPSYVHAGSAVGRLTTSTATQVFGPAAVNGYEVEWRELADVVHGKLTPPGISTLVDDVRFALLLADSAADAVRSAHTAEAAA
jgi:hypothetical protein